MALTGNSIEKVRAFELPAGIWADGRYVESPRTALVKWHSCWPDMFYQVYVNGRYAGATVDSQQRQMIVQVPTSLELRFELKSLPSRLNKRILILATRSIRRLAGAAG